MPPSTTPVHTLPATQLAAMLAAREVSSVELVRAHLDRINAVDPSVRAFTQVLRESSLADAARADDERARGAVRGPLHGLPVTVKESIEMAGAASTLGVVSRRDHRAERDAPVVQMLRDGGAVVLGRTNVSQLLLFHESRNPLFGQTANPFSAAHTPGGSSGGEAAALAAGMSPLGIGTDIGGSIRVPAHFAGVVGLKPTLDRWSNRGCVTGLMGQEAIRGQVGPMARTVGDVALAMRALDARRMGALDGRVPPVVWEDPAGVDVGRLRVGVFTRDEFAPPSRALERALERAAQALRARGCDVVAFTPPDVTANIYRYFAALSSDGGATAKALLAGSEVDPVLLALFRPLQLPAAVRRLASRVAALVGQAHAAQLLAGMGTKPVAAFWQLTNALRTYRFAMEQAFETARIDAVLCPPHATPALPHGGARDFAVAGSYAMLWNVVQFPAGVVPVTRVRADETARAVPADRFERLAVAVDRASAGLPVGVQVVARPWAEATVLAVMAAIERDVAGDPDFPRTPVDPA